MSDDICTCGRVLAIHRVADCPDTLRAEIGRLRDALIGLVRTVREREAGDADFIDLAKAIAVARKALGET